MIRKKLGSRQVAGIVMLTVTVVVFFSLYIWHQTESIRIGYAIDDLEDRAADLKKQVEELEARKSHLLSLERVERIAREALGLTTARKDQVVIGNSDKDAAR